MSRAAASRSAVLALAVVLAALGVAAAKGPASVHPKLRLTAAEVSGSTLHFTVEVTFKPPSGSAACAGKVKLAEKARPRKKAPRWTARLAARGQLCEAEIKGRLPAALLNHRIACRLSFPGNGALAPFSVPEKLKLSDPRGSEPGGTGGAGGPAGAGSPGPGTPGSGPTTLPLVSYTAADGDWQGGGLWDTGSGGNVAFGVEEGIIHDVNIFSSVLLRCEKKDGVPEVIHRYAIFANAPEIALGSAGAFFDKFTDRSEDASADAEIPWVLHGQLGASSGTMVIEAHDAQFDEHFSGSPEYTLSECHASITLAVGKQ